MPPSAVDDTHRVKPESLGISLKVLGWPIGVFIVAWLNTSGVSRKVAAVGLDALGLLQFSLTLFGLNEPTHEVKQFNAVKRVASLQQFTVIPLFALASLVA
jgi:hypothetical protein